MTVHRFLDGRISLPRHKTKRWIKRAVHQIQGVVFHHTAGHGSAADICRYHVGPNHISASGLPGGSYTFMVGPDGSVFWVNDLDDKTASQNDPNRPGSENADFLAVSFLGDFSSPGHVAGQPTLPQLAAGLSLVLHLIGYTEDPRVPGVLLGALGHLFSTDVWGHYHFGKAACPGSTLQAVIEAARWHDPDTGHDALEWQVALNAKGYDDSAPDGIWGPKSRSALVRFQAAHDLPVTGDRDERTERELFRS
ncbi:MAG: peptidoglycan-binding domain-containing protein [Spirochaetes bacterium]|nr:peptidoglycan-binding domain-containing protein [Spirochaetota bacterium]